MNIKKSIAKENGKKNNQASIGSKNNKLIITPDLCFFGN